MPDHRPPSPTSASQKWAAVVAATSAAVLAFEVIVSLVTGQSSLWPLSAAVVLAVSLMLMGSLRRGGASSQSAGPILRRGIAHETTRPPLAGRD